MRLRRLLLPTLILVAGLLAFGRAPDAAFQFDDYPAVVDNPTIQGPLGLEQLLTRRVAGSDYLRPVLTLSYWLTERLAALVDGKPHAEASLPTRSRIHHAGNLVLHLLNAGLVLVLGRSLSRQAGSAPAIAALAFAVHPALSQGVYYVAARSAVLVTTFALGAVSLALRAAPAAGAPSTSRSSAAAAGGFWASSRRLAPALLLTAAALLTKEVAIALPLLIVAMLYVTARPLSPRVVLPHALLAGVALIWWSQAAAAHHQPPVVDYAIMQLRAVARYAELLLWPSALRVDYGWVPPAAAALWPPSPLYDGAHLMAVVKATAFLVALGAGALWLGRRRPLTAAGALWFAIALLPTSSLFPIRDPIFEHRLILAAPGFLLALADCCVAGWQSTSRRYGLPRVAGTVLLCAALATLALQSHHRAQAWETERHLWADCLRRAPGNPRAAFNLASAITAEYAATAESEGTDAAREAEALYRRTLTLHPAYAYGYELRAYATTNLGYLYLEAAERTPATRFVALNRAVAVLDTAVTYPVRAGAAQVPFPDAWSNLGLALLRRAELGRAQGHPGFAADAQRAIRALSTAHNLKPDTAVLRRLKRARRLIDHEADRD